MYDSNMTTDVEVREEDQDYLAWLEHMSRLDEEEVEHEQVCFERDMDGYQDRHNGILVASSRRVETDIDAREVAHQMAVEAYNGEQEAQRQRDEYEVDRWYEMLETT